MAVVRLIRVFECLFGFSCEARGCFPGTAAVFSGPQLSVQSPTSPHPPQLLPDVWSRLLPALSRLLPPLAVKRRAAAAAAGDRCGGGGMGGGGGWPGGGGGSDSPVMGWGGGGGAGGSGGWGAALGQVPRTPSESPFSTSSHCLTLCSQAEPLHHSSFA